MNILIGSAIKLCFWLALRQHPQHQRRVPCLCSMVPLLICLICIIMLLMLGLNIRIPLQHLRVGRVESSLVLAPLPGGGCRVSQWDATVKHLQLIEQERTLTT